MVSIKDTGKDRLRSLIEKWKKEGKSARQISRLRYYHKNKDEILRKRRSLPHLRYKRH